MEELNLARTAKTLEVCNFLSLFHLLSPFFFAPPPSQPHHNDLIRRFIMYLTCCGRKISICIVLIPSSSHTLPSTFPFCSQYRNKIRILSTSTMREANCVILKHRSHSNSSTKFTMMLLEIKYRHIFKGWWLLLLGWKKSSFQWTAPLPLLLLLPLPPLHLHAKTTSFFLQYPLAPSSWSSSKAVAA